jgi:hypothetical protein
MATTREQVLSGYAVNEHGIITSPGKFEGEMLYVPYVYECCMDGGDNGIIVDATDVSLFPELGGVYGVTLNSDSQGFVHARAHETQAEYEAEMGAIDALQSGDDE